jgi:hypothetical protein
MKGLTMADFLQDKRDEIQRRLDELAPLRSEYERLENAVKALDGITGPAATTSSTATPRRRGPGRPPGTKTKPPTAASKKPAKTTPAAKTAAADGGVRPGRPKGSGERSVQALKLVSEHPGIQIPDLAKRMGIKQNYLYRVLPALQKEGKITKQGRGWHPA